MVSNEEGNSAEDAGVQRLEEADKTSEAYLNQLIQQITEVKLRIAEEDADIGQLEDFIRSMKGQLAAAQQKKEALKVPELIGMLDQARDEFGNAKLEQEEVSRQVLARSNEILGDIHGITHEVEELRLQYTNTSTVKDLVKEEEHNLANWKSEVDAAQAEVEGKEAEIGGVATELQSFADSGQLVGYYSNEIDNTQMRIDELRALLRARRSDGLARYP